MKVACDDCGGPHLAQFHAPERVWAFLGIDSAGFLCAECVNSRALAKGVTLAWFVNDENYLNEPNWKSSDSSAAVIDEVRKIHESENIDGYIRCPVCQTDSPCETLEACNLTT